MEHRENEVPLTLYWEIVSGSREELFAYPKTCGIALKVTFSFNFPHKIKGEEP